MTKEYIEEKIKEMDEHLVTATGNDIHVYCEAKRMYMMQLYYMTNKS